MTTRHTCKACSGKRTYEVHTHKMHGGVRCGSAIALTYPCDRCGGKGFVTCLSCDDSGWMPEFDYTTGEYEGDRPCIHCDRGRFVDEQASIDRDREAWEATLPDYDAACHERVAADGSPF